MKRILALILFFVASIAHANTPSTAVVSVVPVIDTNIYASGDALGGKLSLTGIDTAFDGLTSGIISDVVITDLDKESADIDVFFFSSDPSGTTVTNNATLDIADADLDELVCAIEVRDHATFSDNGVSFATNQNCPYVLSGASTLYAVMVVRATPTYTSASDLTLRVGILKD